MRNATGKRRSAADKPIDDAGTITVDCPNPGCCDGIGNYVGGNTRAVCKYCLGAGKIVVTLDLKSATPSENKSDGLESNLNIRLSNDEVVSIQSFRESPPPARVVRITSSVLFDIVKPQYS